MAKTEIVITINEIPPSNNKYLGKSTSYHAYHKEKQRWMDMVGWSVKASGWRNSPFKKAKVQILYFFPNRTRRDPDNYSGKFILDGLRQAGVIEDDSFNNITLILKGVYDKSQPRTMVVVEPDITEAI